MAWKRSKALSFVVAISAVLAQEVYYSGLWPQSLNEHSLLASSCLAEPTIPILLQVLFDNILGSTANVITKNAGAIPLSTSDWGGFLLNFTETNVSCGPGRYNVSLITVAITSVATLSVKLYSVATPDMFTAPDVTSTTPLVMSTSASLVASYDQLTNGGGSLGNLQLTTRQIALDTSASRWWLLTVSVASGATTTLWRPLSKPQDGLAQVRGEHACLSLCCTSQAPRPFLRAYRICLYHLAGGRKSALFK
jgi:hypothetical protein